MIAEQKLNLDEKDADNEYYYCPTTQVVFSNKQVADAFLMKLEMLSKFDQSNEKQPKPAEQKVGKFGIKAKRFKTKEVPELKESLLKNSISELNELLVSKQAELSKISTTLDSKKSDRIYQVSALTVYYGEKVQMLLNEYAKQTPSDSQNGEPRTLKQFIEKWGISKELIKWDDENEDFISFE